jgi:hypothetical protein
VGASASKVGGVVTGVLGWLVLLFGLSSALGLGLLCYAIWTLGIALAVALPIAVISSGIGVPLVLGGKALRRSGSEAERAMREQAILEMLARHGRVTAAQAAPALGVSVEEADALLTAVAKGQPERVAVDVGDEGAVWYRAVAVRVRVDERLAGADAEVDGADENSTGRAREKTGP